MDGTARAYTALNALPLAPGGDDTISLLHISDVHASPLGMDFAQEVARGFDVDLVVDTGDLTSFGTPVENLIVSRIPAFGRPYVFVRGSHDSIELQAAGRAAAERGRPRRRGAHRRRAHDLRARPPGLHAGARRSGRRRGVRGARAFRGRRRSRRTSTSSTSPSTSIAVHDDRMAEAVAGRVPLVISGHFHETTASVVNGTLFLRIGTTGGSGAGIFRDLEAVTFTAEILYFSLGEDAGAHRVRRHRAAPGHGQPHGPPDHRVRGVRRARADARRRRSPRPRRSRSARSSFRLPGSHHDV